MANQKPGIPQGTRDFGPIEMVKRNYIFSVIKDVFQKHGYAQIETPSLEYLDTLLGKYGEEGDKLIYRILDSGEFFSNIRNEILVINEAINISDYLFVNIYSKLVREILKTFSFQDLKRIKKIEDYIQKYTNPDIIISSTIDNTTQRIIKKYINKKYKKIASWLFDFIRNTGLSDISREDEIIFSLNQYCKKSQHFIQIRTHLITKYIPIEKTKALKEYDITKLISEKGLRYDLTVPFARYVVQHQHEITFPFKRYQIQPVWRADRPQKGRYREFYQCDVDVIGSNSLLNEVELIQIIDEVFNKLEIKVQININNRKILSGIAEFAGAPEKILDITIALDKLEKIGWENVVEELLNKGIQRTIVDEFKKIVQVIDFNNEQKVIFLNSILKDSVIGTKGVEEMNKLFSYLKNVNVKSEINFNLTLARGLNYYTGAIFEVKAMDMEIGSICGGGRYDDLTGIFGLPGTSGVGVSFGADRIYDVMNQLELFPAETSSSSRLLITNFGEEESSFCLSLLAKLRNKGIRAELYPDAVKLGKQISYANSRQIPFVALVGENEIRDGQVSLKRLSTGEQMNFSVDALIEFLLG